VAAVGRRRTGDRHLRVGTGPAARGGARRPARAGDENDERETEQRTVPRERVEAAVVDGEARDEQERR
jgi:hypothetical protein